MNVEPVRLILQLGIILIVAKLVSELFKRYLRQPEVLGELIAGMLIGPYALGAFISIPSLGPLFARPEGATASAISSELYAIAQIAIIILFFSTGLDTDLRGLIRYGGPSALVALGGIIIPFFLGDLAAVLGGYAKSLADPPALFVGAILATPSVGVATRILEEMGKLRTPEGVMILGSAMINAIFIVLILMIVAGLSSKAGLRVKDALLTAGMAVLFLLLLTGFVAFFAKPLSRFLGAFRSEGALVALGLALAFIGSALAQLFGLTAIIGAFGMGLALSTSGELAVNLKRGLSSLQDAFVPIFFTVMGMLFEVRTLGPALLFGLLLTVIAIVGKLLGCGLPALALRFTQLGALRIGFGATPRGGFALAVALTGMALGAISKDLFAVVVLMTAISVLIAPPVLSALFRKEELTSLQVSK